jgi:type VI secretion system protein ImpB
MGESIQHKLGRVRPPRVQITYDVEIGNAIEVKELPFVMGIMADLSGMQEDDPLPLKERKFIEIDRDNFNDIMASIRPRLTMSVPNKLTNDEGMMGAELVFNDLEAFNPINVLKQIEPLRKLFEARTLLKDLLTKLDGNDKLDKLLEEVLLNTEKLDALKGELGVTDAPAGDTPAEGA